MKYTGLTDEQIKEYIEDGARWVFEFRFMSANYRVIEIDEGDIDYESCGFTDGSGDGSFPIGQAICRILNVRIFNEDQAYDDINFKGAIITAYIKLMYEGEEMATVALGDFTVTTPTLISDIIDLVAYDDMYRTDKEIADTIIEMDTAKGMWDLAALNCGISSDNPFPDYNIGIANKPIPGTTYRQIFADLAAICGGCAYINDSGRIAVKNTVFNTDPCATIAIGDWSEFPQLSAESVRITGVRVTGTYIDANDEEQSVDVLRGDSGYVYNIDNGFTAYVANDLSTAVYDDIGNKNIRPFTGEIFSNPLLEYLDVINITTKRGTYQAVITDLSFQQGSVTNISCTIPDEEDNDNRYGSATQDEIDTIKKEYNPKVSMRTVQSSSVSIPNNSATAVCNITLEPGMYCLHASARWATNGTGTRRLSLSTSPNVETSDRLSGEDENAATSGYTRQHYDYYLILKEEKTYYLNAYQDSGAARNGYFAIQAIKFW